VTRAHIYAFASLGILILALAYINRGDILASYRSQIQQNADAVRPERTRADVEAACEIAIRDELASPSDVSFPSNLDTERPRAIFYDDKTWRYIVPVRGQNGLGSGVTERFLCVFDDGSGVVRSVESSG
jgi:hypothetical protein